MMLSSLGCEVIRLPHSITDLERVEIEGRGRQSETAQTDWAGKLGRLTAVLKYFLPCRPTRISEHMFYPSLALATSIFLFTNSSLRR